MNTIRKATIALAVVLLLAMLTGCMKLELEFTIGSDGKVDVSMLQALSDEMAEDSEFAMSSAEVEDYEAQGWTVEEYAQDGYTGVILKCADVNLSEAELLEGATGGLRKEGSKYILDLEVFSQEGEEDFAQTAAMLSAAGASYKVRVNLPAQPIAHNATSVSEDGKTLEWDLLLLVGTETLHAEYEIAEGSESGSESGTESGSEGTEEEPTATKPVWEVFSDVNQNDWFVNFLQAAYDNGIIGGFAEGVYKPDNSLTHAQIMVIAANLHSKQKGDNFKAQAAEAGTHWATPFLAYCKAEGIIDDRFDNKLNDEVNRGEMAYYFANVLTEESYKDKQTIAFNDVQGNAYEAEIMKLAKADIVGGKGEGIYDPAAFIKRSEAAVFISNILNAIE